MSSTRAINPSASEGGRTWAAAVGPRAPMIVLVALLGLVLGALLGAGLGARHQQARTASALLEIQPDPPVASDLSASTGTPSDSAVTAFMATELVYLQSAQFSHAVAEAVGGGGVDVKATQVQGSNVVEISALDPSPARALKVDQAATDLYVKNRVADLTATLARQYDSVTTQLAITQQQLQTLPVAATTTSSAQRSALQGYYLDLLSANGEVTQAQAQVKDVATQLQPATLTATGGLDPVVSGALVGAALGALIAAAVVVLLRRASPAVGGAAELEPYGVPVLTPAMPHRRLGGSSLDDPVLQRVVAAQDPQLTSEVGRAPGLVVMGASTGAGASFVALQHALYSARRRSTLLVRVASPDDDALGEGLGADLASAAFRELLVGPVRGDRLHTVVQDTSFTGLAVLSIGPDAEQGIAHLETVLGEGLVAAAQDAGYHLVLDAPPLDSSTAGLVAAREVGAAVLVVALDRTQRADVERALESAAVWRVRLSGMALNLGGLRRSGGSPLVPFRGRTSRRSSVAPTPTGVR